MAASDTNSKKGSKPSSPCNWLQELDKKVRELPAGSNWLDVLGPQRCRFFIMARFPDLRRPLADSVLDRELSRGEKLIEGSSHSKLIQHGLNAGQVRQLAGLLLDIIEALKFHTRHRQSSKDARKLAAEAERRTRMLFSKVLGIRRSLESLATYAEPLHPVLGLEFVRAAELCLKTLDKLKKDSYLAEFCALLKSEYPPLEDPRQLGMVELYWFFHYECRRSGPDSEVRVAILANDFLASSLKYIPKYNREESRGCPAVRIAVSRFRPRTAI